MSMQKTKKIFFLFHFKDERTEWMLQNKMVRKKSGLEVSHRNALRAMLMAKEPYRSHE